MASIAMRVRVACRYLPAPRAPSKGPTRHTYDGGDHLVLVGEVLRYRRYDRQPLLFVKGRYAVSADHPSTRVFATTAKAERLEDGQERVLSNLMIRAYSAIASRLERGRQTAGLGLTLMQARFLRGRAASPDPTPD